KESSKKISEIEDIAMLARGKATADASYYTMERESEGNKLILTESYLELKKYNSLAQNAKYYFGNKIPNFLANLDSTPTPVATTTATTTRFATTTTPPTPPRTSTTTTIPQIGTNSHSFVKRYNDDSTHASTLFAPYTPTNQMTSNPSNQ
ncbi:hypothetical protein, partial [Salmonella sp. s51228]|uniref:hypothetical protein n=1 Tax=Salmonella sp. s51228 TaxID=3159652 RepID=UPI0039811E5F